MRAARLTNRNAKFAGLSINTSGLPASERGAYLESAAAETGLPCIDPVANSSDAIAEYIIENF
jgi:uncharacterized NAD-dependent epimerase/dehydratase family protein